MYRIFLAFNLAILVTVSLMACSGANSETSEVQGTVPSVADPSSPASKTTGAFNVDSAMAYLKQQTDFGPRVPGSAAHKACADMLAQTLKAMGATVSDSVAQSVHPVSGNPVEIRNIFAQFNPAASDRVLVLAHYDTRPWADEDADPANRNTPIDGANDGASGVAVALEIARHAGSLPKGKGLDILLVDQEDSGSSGDDVSWCLGSTYWAANLPYDDMNRPRYAILLDMVGGKNAEFRREYFSELAASRINDIVWKAAREAGYGSRFVDDIGGAINDDHLPIIRAGIPAIDIIETTPTGFNPTWHTLQDNFENIDPKTIEMTGNVMYKVIYR